MKMELDDHTPNPRRGDSDKGNGKPKAVEIEVNNKAVKLPKTDVSGLEIKETAVAQGVNIQVSFVLQQELPNGSSKIIGDGDMVHLREHLRFTAIAPDDNS
jgi:hypothetical protein